jgi:hypothetical protein
MCCNKFSREMDYLQSQRMSTVKYSEGVPDAVAEMDFPIFQDLQ